MFKGILVATSILSLAAGAAIAITAMEVNKRVNKQSKAEDDEEEKQAPINDSVKEEIADVKEVIGEAVNNFADKFLSHFKKSDSDDEEVQNQKSGFDIDKYRSFLEGLFCGEHTEDDESSNETEVAAETPADEAEVVSEAETPADEAEVAAETPADEAEVVAEAEAPADEAEVPDDDEEESMDKIFSTLAADTSVHDIDDLR